MNSSGGGGRTGRLGRMSGGVQVSVVVTAFDVTAALHTYLRVNDVRKTRIDGLSGARYRDKRLRQDDLLESAPLVRVSARTGANLDG